MIPQQLSDKILKKNIPISAMFELTWRCNLKCIHCFQCPPTNEELTTEEIKKILDQLAEAGCLFLTFTGGEPLLRKDFFEIAEYAQEKKFVVTLYTNGTLITPEIAEKISKTNFLYVQISLHGATPKTHDKITKVEGSFYKTIEAIKILKNKGVKVGIATTIMKPNFSELEKIEELHHHLATDESRFSPMVYPTNEGNKEPLKLNLEYEQLKTFFSFIFKKNMNSLEKRSIIRGLWCGAGRSGCCINAKGEVYPCVALPISVGNLKKETFKKIWSTAPLLKWIRTKNVSDLKECQSCELAYYCCRCSALAYWEGNGLLDPASSCCQQAKALKEVADERKKDKKEVFQAEVSSKENYCSLL
ncbi:MAG TPA: radical SAM protein [Candidatus Omnitrophica bacterium]|nr:radical SAM protein [Candidatus Omnitrophota bacterium]